MKFNSSEGSNKIKLFLLFENQTQTVYMSCWHILKNQIDEKYIYSPVNMHPALLYVKTYIYCSQEFVLSAGFDIDLMITGSRTESCKYQTIKTHISKCRKACPKTLKEFFFWASTLFCASAAALNITVDCSVLMGQMLSFHWVQLT